MEVHVIMNPQTVRTAFAASGTLHLLAPKVFKPMVPRLLPRPTAFVYASGVAELVCAAGLAARARWAGPASAALLLAVWPANLQMALDVTRRSGSGPMSKAALVAVWARMPMQIPLIRAALSARPARA